MFEGIENRATLRPAAVPMRPPLSDALAMWGKQELPAGAPPRYSKNPALARTERSNSPVARQLLRLKSTGPGMNSVVTAVRSSELHPQKLLLLRDQGQDSAQASSREKVVPGMKARTVVLDLPALLKRTPPPLPVKPQHLIRNFAAPVGAADASQAITTGSAGAADAARSDLLHEIRAMNGVAGLKQRVDDREMALADQAWAQQLNENDAAAESPESGHALEAPIDADAVPPLLDNAGVAKGQLMADLMAEIRSRREDNGLRATNAVEQKSAQDPSEADDSFTRTMGYALKAMAEVHDLSPASDDESDSGISHGSASSDVDAILDHEWDD